MIRDLFIYISYLLVTVSLFHLVGINGIIENPVGGVVSSAACCPSASICGSFPLALTDTEGQK